MYSLGEIEAQCKKASKGVGLSWGLAEEAGLIARHLSEFNLPGSDTVYINLKFIEDNGWEDNLIDIKFIEQIGKPISGLLLGVMLLDQLSNIADYRTSFEVPVIGPLAVVGALLRLQNERYFFSLSWENCQITMDDDGFSVLGKNLNPKIVRRFVISICTSSKKPVFDKEKNKRVQIKSWQLLTKMAHKTYVPESATSRLRGAGAGENENE
tara:strand:+ start:364 stop:996 length:633 start_codon:yes stop_codon:yes gene_type:complete